MISSRMLNKYRGEALKHKDWMKRHPDSELPVGHCQRLLNIILTLTQELLDQQLLRKEKEQR